MAPPGSALAAIAPSSTPKGIYDALWDDVNREDTHSALIKGYRRTFKRLSAQWGADGSITGDQQKEILATINSASWKIWRPVLYVINRDAVVTRVKNVPHHNRAAYGPELQIADLRRHEFDLIEPHR